jgi:DNA (cytosine-5)-methyltransferase 1
MKLYEEILFLQGYFKGKFVVENVKSWYKPLIQPQECGKHWFWSNFIITPIKTQSREHDSKIEILQKRKGFDLSRFKDIGIEKKLLLRNCVELEVGLHIFNCAFSQTRLSLPLAPKVASIREEYL